MVDALEHLKNAGYQLEDAGFTIQTYIYHDETPAHRYVSALCTGICSEFLVLLTARDSFNSRLCGSIVEFLQQHASSLSPDCGQTILEGFQAPGDTFDSVMVLNGGYHKSYEHVDRLLKDITLEVFPIYRCEFTGHETGAEIDVIRHDGPCTIDWNRSPCPYVLMNLYNQRTGVGSYERTFFYSNVKNTLHETQQLEDDGVSYVEIVNFRNVPVTISKSAQGYRVMAGEGRSLHLDSENIQNWIDGFLVTGTAEL